METLAPELASLATGLCLDAGIGMEVGDAWSWDPLRRVIQSMIEDPLAEALLVGSFKAGDTVKVDRDDESGLSIEAVTEKTPVEAA